jgi:hypothetical protein
LKVQPGSSSSEVALEGSGVLTAAAAAGLSGAWLGYVCVSAQRFVCHFHPRMMAAALWGIAAGPFNRTGLCLSLV